MEINKETDQESLQKRYQEVISRTQYLLEEDQEWAERYRGYYEALSSKSLKKIKKRVRVTEPLFKYTTISDELKTKREIIILRYKGQEVGRIKEKDDDTYLQISKTTAKKNEEYFGDPEKNSAAIIGTPIETKWDGNEAQAFRKYFKDYDKEKMHNREHMLESKFLTEISKNKSENKSLLYIQPIKLNGKRFQMPTPLKASTIKDNIDNLRYSGGHGGGIDILARRKKGNQSYITLIELKDEFCNNEPPAKVMNQVIAYATFIRELVRNKTANEKGSWYRMMGFTDVIENKPITIYCVVAMPNIEDNIDIDMFKNISLYFNDNSPYADDKLELHCISISISGEDEIKLMSDKDF
jgi:hypothetical protein